MRYQTFATQLGENGHCVWPNFLSNNALNDTRDDLNAIHKSGSFVRASTGQGSAKEIRDITRRDEIHWLDRELPNQTQNNLWLKLDKLKQAFNRSLFLGILNFEGHYASYPIDGFYRRHIDCFQHDDARIVSFVLYLNLAWQKSDGGNLRIYGNESHTDINPLGGTMVCFLSREIEHEVLLSHAARFSFTGWFKTANTR